MLSLSHTTMRGGRARARIRRLWRIANRQQAPSPFLYCLLSLFFLETFDPGYLPRSPLLLVRHLLEARLNSTLTSKTSDTLRPQHTYTPTPAPTFFNVPFWTAVCQSRPSNIIPSHAPCTASASARLRPRRRQLSRPVSSSSCPHCEPHVAVLYGTTLSGIAPEIDGRVQRSMERYSPLFFCS